MKYQLALEFSNPTDAKESFELRWQIMDTNAALFWLKLIFQANQLGLQYEQRFTGFLSPHKTVKSIREDLSKSIAVINKSGLYKIPETGDEEFSQEFSNKIHHHFEVLVGSREINSEIFKKAEPQTRLAICQLNYDIHDLESLYRTMTRSTPYSPAVIFQGLNVPRFSTPDELYRDFTLNIEFGDMFYHYDLIGKTWLEVFLDGDQEIFNDAIRPLTIINSAFDLFFYDYDPGPEQRERLKNFLINRGLDPREPKLALGFLPIAKLIRPQNSTPTDLNSQIARCLKVSKVQLFEGKSPLFEIPVNLGAL